MKKTSVRFAVTLGLLGMSSGAHATLVSNLSPSCPGQTLAQTFLPFGDPFQYAAVPNGNLESGATGWTLRGATIVAGNETFHVGRASDSASLMVPAGASATSPSICVGTLSPTVRFFTRSPNLLAALEVDAVYNTSSGTVTVPAGVVTATNAWQPTLPLPLLLNATALLTPTGTFPMALRFKAISGTWQIDDIYVDPYKRG